MSYKEPNEKKFDHGMIKFGDDIKAVIEMPKI